MGDDFDFTIVAGDFVDFDAGHHGRWPWQVLGGQKAVPILPRQAAGSIQSPPDGGIQSPGPAAMMAPTRRLMTHGQSHPSRQSARHQV